ncbi:recombination protein NinB [Rhizobium sp. LC145]|uniref:recombination protein NinB n=1 Tax=Rhizobium sp. LC145 TaxID=1120688 RepID=UPI00062A15A4|nr:recombination protein NinB [Rhizobium sp. LC145]KKX29227.1 NinB family protein [Rhizobium sp. LC145]TKT68826.1 NinB family protein [Rhizobiaceae bacterium LC148]
MGRALLVLANDAFRQKAIDWIRRAPRDARVEFKGPKRTTPQNDRMWAMLTDLSLQLAWHGQQLTPEDWKLVMLDALRREKSEQIRMVPNTDGSGFVPLGTSSSDLSKDEMTDLIEIIFAFGAQQGVEWSEPKGKAA